MTGVLEIDGISKSFDGRPALRKVSLNVQPGTIHGLIGHNGAGKSTLVRILAGYYSQDDGQIVFNGEALSPGLAPDRRRALGLRFVHQDLGLVGGFTAAENFGLGAGYSESRWRTIDWAAQERTLREAVGLLGSDLRYELPASQLTAVERSVLAIARAIAGTERHEHEEARLLVLDEPTTALEAPEVAHLFQVVRTLASGGVGVLYISHRLTDISDLCMEVTVLRDGTVVDSVKTADTPVSALVTAMAGDGPESGKRPIQSTSDHIGRVVRGGRSPTPAKVQVPSRPAYAVQGLRSSLLRGVDLKVYPGEIICVVGLTGSGREEFVYAAVGAVSAQADAIEVEGCAIGGLNPGRARALGIALVPGNRARGSIIDAFSIRENLTLVCLDAVSGRGGHIRTVAERAVAQDWTTKLAIQPNNIEFACRHLSGGNKQKVILAKWLSIKPAVMLIDEPSAGVDVATVRVLFETLRTIADDGAALVVSTSEIDDAIVLADRIVVLRDGRVGTELDRARDQISSDTIVLAMTERR